MFEFLDSLDQDAVIKVIGLGDAGINTVKQMMRDNVDAVQFIVMDTDPQAIGAYAHTMLLSGGDKGLVATPEVDAHIPHADRENLRALLVGADMVFIIAGMGGSTGTHYAPIVAMMAREMGILTVAIVAESGSLEGELRMSVARQGSTTLIRHVDSLFTLPSGKFLRERDASPQYAFKAATEVAMAMVWGIADLVVRPGLINVDFKDVDAVMASMGPAMMATGTASGDDRTEEAVGKAIIGLLGEDVDLARASGILVNITSDLDMMIEEFETVGNAVKSLASESAIVVVGTVIDPEMQGEMRVTLIATGIDVERKPDPTPFSRPYFEARSVAKSQEIPALLVPRPSVAIHCSSMGTTRALCWSPTRH